MRSCAFAPPAEGTSGIAEVHVEGSRGAYAGLLPAEFLACFTVERRAMQWARELDVDPSWTHVLDLAGRVVGFSNVGPSRDEDAEQGTGELIAIYLTPTLWVAAAASGCSGLGSSDFATRATARQPLGCWSQSSARGTTSALDGASMVHTRTPSAPAWRWTRFATASRSVRTRPLLTARSCGQPPRSCRLLCRRCDQITLSVASHVWNIRRGRFPRAEGARGRRREAADQAPGVGRRGSPAGVYARSFGRRACWLISEA